MSRWYLWVDLETTGLDHVNDKIVEAAFVLTNDKLEELGRCQYVIGLKDWSKANEWAIKAHKENGLIAECMVSRETCISVEYRVIEMITAAFPDLTKRGPFLTSMGGSVMSMPSQYELLPSDLKNAGHDIMIAGSTVHFDRTFIARDMKRLNDFLHYRHFDVSAVVEGVRMMTGKYFDRPKAHRAMPDIESSIKQLMELRDAMPGLFKQS